MKTLDLFSAAAGGWSLGMHRAGFQTIAACENIQWRRILYAQNNPGVPIYDDVVTLTADRLLRDIGELPAVIVGSPPCQDISSANTKGKGVEGERSGLFFEAIRLIGECRPRWFALENSANLRTRGADAVLAALEDLGYACWPLVVRASDIGANHERPRSWLIGCDLGQVTDPNGFGSIGFGGRGFGIELSVSEDTRDAASFRRSSWSGDVEGPWRKEDGREFANSSSCRDDADSNETQWRPHELAGSSSSRGEVGRHEDTGQPRGVHWAGSAARNTPDPDQAGQADGCMVAGIRQAEITDDGRRDGRSIDRSSVGQMAIRPDDRGAADGAWPLWSLDDLAGRLRLDVGLPARLAGTRVAVGGPRGTSAASLVVEAYGDSVVPQIPEAIGRAILRVERAMTAVGA